MPVVPLWDEGEGYRSFPISRQRRLNCYIEQRSSFSNYSIQGPDKTPIAVYGTHGLTLFTNTGSTPVRGVRTIPYLNVTYFVAGNTVYYLNTNGNQTAIGTINSATGLVGMTDSGENGLQLLIVDGVNGWIVNLSNNSLTMITSAGFPVPAPTTCTFLGGYFIVNQPGSGEFFWSQVYNGLIWNALQFATAEYDPNNLLAVTVNLGQLLLWCERTIEVWTLSGDSRIFARIGGSAVQWGLGSVYSIAFFGDNVMYLAKNRMGQFQVAMLQGTTSQAVSTAEVEYDLNMQGAPQQATAYSYLYYGHMMYQINFPNKSYLYDGTSNAWSEVGSSPLGTYPPGRHYGNIRFELNSVPYVCDYRNGNIYVADSANYTDNGDPIITEMDLKHVFEPGLGYQTIDEFQIDMETGVGVQGITAPPNNDALFFDGLTQYVNIPNNAAHNLLGPFTVMLWMYPAYNLQFAANIILAQMNSGSGGLLTNSWAIKISQGAGTYTPSVSLSNSVGGVTTVNFIISNVPELQWHHMAITVSSSNLITGYFDAVNLGSASLIGSFTAPSGAITISCANVPGASPTQFFNGTIDDFRIYNAALTPAQIASASSSPPGFNDPNLVSAYEFSEGSGTTAIDLQGVQNGTLTNYLGTTNPTYVGGYPGFNPTVGADPKVMFSTSRDGGRTFGNERQLAIGKLGGYYNKCFALGVGCSRDFVAKLKVSDPIKRAFANAQLRIR